MIRTHEGRGPYKTNDGSASEIIACTRRPPTAPHAWVGDDKRRRGGGVTRRTTRGIPTATSLLRIAPHVPDHTSHTPFEGVRRAGDGGAIPNTTRCFSECKATAQQSARPPRRASPNVRATTCDDVWRCVR